MRVNSNDDHLFRTSGQSIEQQVDSLDDRITDLRDHVQAQLNDLRRSLIVLVLRTMLGSAVVTFVLCLLTS